MMCMAVKTMNSNILVKTDYRCSNTFIEKSCFKKDTLKSVSKKKRGVDTKVGLSDEFLSYEISTR